MKTVTKKYNFFLNKTTDGVLSPPVVFSRIVLYDKDEKQNNNILYINFSVIIIKHKILFVNS